MPNSLDSAIVFALVIAPGYMFVRGFSLGRAHIPPARDLYILAEAVVASVVWLAAFYLANRGLLERYGLLPVDEAVMEAHTLEIGRLLLVIVLAPYVVGRVAGTAARVGGRAAAQGVKWVLENVPGDLPGWGGLWRRGVRRLAKAVGESPLLRPPTSWDRAWATARDDASIATVHLKDGGMVRGSLASVDVSPLPRQVVLANGQGFDEEGVPIPLALGPNGVYLEGAEIKAVYFEVS